MKIEFPVLQANARYFIGGITEKAFQIAGELNLNSKCFIGVRYIDAKGQEWKVLNAESTGYTSIWQYLQPRKYRSVKVKFKLERGQIYDLDTLRKEIEGFIYNHKLRGSPFHNKRKEVPEWLAQFGTIRDLTSYKMYLDW